MEIDVKNLVLNSIYSPETVPEKMETETLETEDISEEIPGEIPVSRPSTLSITTPDDALDMSANNTLSFVFTQPPRLFTVNVRCRIFFSFLAFFTI